MSNGSASLDEQEMSFNQRLELIKAMQGITSEEIPPDDEKYAIFTAGELAEKEYKRVAKPPQSVARQVSELRCCYSMVSENIKEAICKEWGWDMEDKCSEELSRYAFQEKVLPLICRDLPEDHDFDNTNGSEIDRMLHDFLLGT